MKPIHLIRALSLLPIIYLLSSNAVEEQGHFKEPDDGVVVYCTFMVLVCVVSAALASGLTQGLLSLNTLEMRIKLRSGTAQEKKWAAKVLPIITKHHLLLVTLMLFNATATEALPLFLDQLVPSYITIILSVTCVLVFGEILPGAVLTGPNQLEIAAKLTPLVWCLICILLPVAYPISAALDYWLGADEGITVYNRDEISTMMKIQMKEGRKRGKSVDTVNKDEVKLLDGALHFRRVTVEKVMTTTVFMLSIKERLNYETIAKIFKSGFSRIPIYDKDRNDVVGLLLTKDLIFLDPQDEVPLSRFVEVFGRKFIFVFPDMQLGEVLVQFKRSHCHLAIVRDVNNTLQTDPFYEVRGLVTMEDIFEEILGEDIYDETDLDHENSDSRNIDFAQLKLTASQKDNTRLSDEEVKVVTAHLLANVPQIKHYFEQLNSEIQYNLQHNYDSAASNTSTASQSQQLQHQHHQPLDIAEEVRKLVLSSSVMCFNTSSSTSSSKNNSKDYLYTRNKATNACTLILSGKCTVLAGKEEFKVEVGAWQMLAADVFLDKEGLLMPDFSCFVGDNCELRCLRITKPSDHSVITSSNIKQTRRMMRQVHFQVSPKTSDRKSHGQEQKLATYNPLLSEAAHSTQSSSKSLTGNNNRDALAFGNKLASSITSGLYQNQSTYSHNMCAESNDDSDDMMLTKTRSRVDERLLNTSSNSSSISPLRSTVSKGQVNTHKKKQKELQKHQRGYQQLGEDEEEDTHDEFEHDDNLV